MTDFDKTLKRRTRREDTPLPEGFEERLEKRLAELPSGRRRPKVAVLAACLCLVAAGIAAAAGLWGVFTDGQQKVGPDGQSVGYDLMIQGMTRFPVQELGEYVLEEASRQAEAIREAENGGPAVEVLRPEGDWAQAEVRIGLPLARNALLEEYPLWGGCIVNVVPDQEGQPIQVSVEGAYRLDGGVKAVMTALIQTDRAPEGEDLAAGLYWADQEGAVEVSARNYPLADGGAGVIFTAQYPQEDQEASLTSCVGALVMDGIYYSVTLYSDAGENPEERLVPLMEDILEAFS